VHGFVSLEIGGNFGGMGIDAGLLFETEVATLGAKIGQVPSCAQVAKVPGGPRPAVSAANDHLNVRMSGTARQAPRIAAALLPRMDTGRGANSAAVGRPLSRCRGACLSGS
jgi:hypothetical protein